MFKYAASGAVLSLTAAQFYKPGPYHASERNRSWVEELTDAVVQDMSSKLSNASSEVKNVASFPADEWRSVSQKLNKAQNQFPTPLFVIPILGVMTFSLLRPASFLTRSVGTLAVVGASTYHYYPHEIVQRIHKFVNPTWYTPEDRKTFAERKASQLASGLLESVYSKWENDDEKK